MGTSSLARLKGGWHMCDIPTPMPSPTRIGRLVGTRSFLHGEHLDSLSFKSGRARCMEVDGIPVSCHPRVLSDHLAPQSLSHQMFAPREGTAEEGTTQGPLPISLPLPKSQPSFPRLCHSFSSLFLPSTQHRPPLACIFSNNTYPSASSIYGAFLHSLVALAYTILKVS